MRPINTLVIHHSACGEGSVERFTKEHAARGFGTIGYHAVIGNGHGQADGLLRNGRPDGLRGCGVFGANTGKLHICLVGNFHRPDPGFTGRPSAHQYDALGGWLLEKGLRYGIPANHVVGHREVTVPGHATACPGSEFPLADVRKWYAFALVCHKTGTHTPSLSGWLEHEGHAFTDDWPNGKPPAVVIVKGTVAKQYTGPVKIIEGKTYVAVSDFAMAMNWPQPDWNADTREVSVHTDTK